jgi:hypothetical protein
MPSYCDQLPSRRAVETGSRNRRRRKASHRCLASTLGLVLESESRRDRLLERLGQCRGDGRALDALDNVSPRTTGSLASEWRCNALTATRIVDRLEAPGMPSADQWSSKAPRACRGKAHRALRNQAPVSITVSTSASACTMARWLPSGESAAPGCSCYIAKSRS